MNEEEQMRQKEHWRALAELLGLEPEPEPAPPPPAAPVADREEAEYPARGKSEAAAGEPALLPETASPRGRRRRPTVPAEETPEGAAAPGPEATELLVAPEPVETEEPLPAGRRRGRRTSRAGRSEAPTAVETEEEKTDVAETHAVTPAAAEKMPAESPRRRGRGPKRQKKAAETADQVESEEAAEPATPQAELEPAESDLDETDALTDWNVPSWQELIASLYRPER
jgi:hypothetical protein